MSLSDWVTFGWVTIHHATREEIRALLAVADRDLKDSAVAGLSDDSQLGLAYNAALQAATAALAAAGYRSARDAKHMRTIESLAFTIQLEPTAVRKFDAFRRKRNVSDYERAGSTSPREAAEMRAFAIDLRARVQAWLEGTHGELM